MVASRIRLDQLLLGATYWNKKVRKSNEPLMPVDLASNIFGKTFQTNLRYKLHKNNPEYRCPACNKEGQHTGVLVDESDKKFQAFVAEIANLATYEATEDAINVIRKAGFTLPDNTTHLSKKNKALAGSTPIFRAVLKKNLKVRAYLKENSPKPNIGLKKDPKEVARLTQKLVDNIHSTYYEFLKPCPVCGGNGYLDIGHDSFVGKQSDLVHRVFLTKIKASAKPDWKSTISVEELNDMFSKLAVEPQIPEVMSRVGIENLTKKGYLKLSDVATFTTNQLQIKKDIAAQVKIKVYSITQRYYETGTSVNEGIVTYQQVITFFNKLIHTARVDTGTLKAKIRKQLISVQDSSVMHGGVEAPYLSSMIVIDGATAHEALMRSGKTLNKSGKPRSSSLFVYAFRFKNELSWGKRGNEELVDIESSAFGKPAKTLGLKIKYFPQRVN